MNIRVVKKDNTIIELQPEITINKEKTIVKLSKDKIPTDIKYVDFLYDFFVANIGDKGYFVLPLNCEQGVCVTYFKNRNDTEFATNFSHICCYGYKKENGGIMGIITGCREYYAVVAGVKDGIYYAYPRFMLDGFKAYEDIVIEYYNLENGDYSEMASLYRKIQLERYGCIPLSERVKNNEILAKAAKSIAVRVRQGWKPAPSAVENQTLETEPEMYVACDFDRTTQLVEEFSKQGIDGAEFCLVGWSRMGHDGRYPQIFPVEPLLGGEEKLKELISKTKSLGYNIVGHDNASDAYTVSELWDEEYLLKNNDGSLHKIDIWSSGRAHKICPKRYYELFGKEHLTQLKELGFEGVHYIDVITILSLLECHDKNHPLTRKETAEWYNRLMQESKETFGGISSESGYDYAAAVLDFALYTSFFLSGVGLPEICDKPIPFWQIVFHGIILYNPGTFTLNYAAKGTENRLRYFEYGGRPLVCVYANFANGKDWMGLEDFRCDTDAEMQESVSKIKTMYNDYKWMEEVRFAFIESHNEVSDNVFEIMYSNGIKITVDYNTATVTMNGNGIEKVLKI